MKPFAVALVVVLAGCGSQFTRSELEAYPQAYSLRNRAVVDEPESLFPSDIAVLNDSAIKRILSYQVTLPHAGRLAVLQLSEPRVVEWWQDPEDFNRINQELSDSMLVALRRSPRIGRAAVLPAMMVPRQRTIPFLREAAARYQADLLLGYRTSCQLFRRSRFLKGSQYRTVCSVEAILLDTRSGIVPFTVVTTRSQIFEKEKEDFETREAIVKAQFQATQDALGDVASQVGEYLASVPETEP
jgi:hypothetical protein